MTAAYYAIAASIKNGRPIEEIIAEMVSQDKDVPGKLVEYLTRDIIELLNQSNETAPKNPE